MFYVHEVRNLLRASNFRTPARRAGFENFRLWSIGGSGGLLRHVRSPPEADIKRKGRHVRWAANRRLIHRSKRYCCRPDTLAPELAAARQKANITKIRGVRQLTTCLALGTNVFVGSNRIEKMKAMSDWLSRAATCPRDYTVIDGNQITSARGIGRHFRV